MINRRNFLRTAAAAVLGLVAGGEKRIETTPNTLDVRMSGGLTWGGELSEAEIQLIKERLATMRKLAIPTYLIINGDDIIFPWGVNDPWPVEDESGVFPGPSHLITTGQCDDT